MKTLNGTASRQFRPILGEATFIRRPFYQRSNKIFITPHMDFHSLGYAGCVTDGKKGNILQPDCIYACQNISDIQEGDIISLNPNGTVTVEWDMASEQNSFMLTEACNCRCLMCPQPPKDHSPALLEFSEKVLSQLRGKHIPYMCITGGEPTLLQDKFIQFLRKCVSEHPESCINILTNGKLFSDFEFTKEATAFGKANVMFCVSFHSDIDTIHDKIVGSKGSYDKTQHGIYHLAQCGAHIEIRHVISKLNYKRLPQFAAHLYDFFPFCTHYALMGLEVHGYAHKNKAQVTVTPAEFSEPLTEAVLFMKNRGMPVSVYNTPLCFCDPRIQNVAARSISTWKNRFPQECDGCMRKDDCAGFFSTSSEIPIEYIHPIKEEK